MNGEVEQLASFEQQIVRPTTATKLNGEENHSLYSVVWVVRAVKSGIRCTRERQWRGPRGDFHSAGGAQKLSVAVIYSRQDFLYHTE